MDAPGKMNGMVGIKLLTGAVYVHLFRTTIVLAQGKGFASKAEYEESERLGFANKKEYDWFKQSDFDAFDVNAKNAMVIFSLLPLPHECFLCDL